MNKKRNIKFDFDILLCMNFEGIHAYSVHAFDIATIHVLILITLYILL